MSRVYLEKIVAASLLGDGCVHIPKNGFKNAIYTTSKTVNHADYIEWLQERLETLTRVNRTLTHPSKYVPNAKDAIVIRSGAHSFYTNFRNRMYGTGIKCVDRHYLTLLDWEFLAVWYQEDGTMNVRQRARDKKPDIQISLATNCFSYGDQMLLKLALKEKLGLDWNIRQYTANNGTFRHTLHLRRLHAEHFCNMIAPYIVPSFQYKCSYVMPRDYIAGEDMIRTI